LRTNSYHQYEDLALLVAREFQLEGFWIEPGVAAEAFVELDEIVQTHTADLSTRLLPGCAGFEANHNSAIVSAALAGGPGLQGSE